VATITGWIRDLVGIGKELTEKKKAELEIENLEAERKEKSSLIQRATLELAGRIWTAG